MFCPNKCFLKESAKHSSPCIYLSQQCMIQLWVYGGCQALKSRHSCPNDSRAGVTLTGLLTAEGFCLVFLAALVTNPTTRPEKGMGARGRCSSGVEIMTVCFFARGGDWCCWFAKFSSDCEWQKYLVKELVRSRLTVTLERGSLGMEDGGSLLPLKRIPFVLFWF